MQSNSLYIEIYFVYCFAALYLLLGHLVNLLCYCYFLELISMIFVYFITENYFVMYGMERSVQTLLLSLDSQGARRQ